MRLFFLTRTFLLTLLLLVCGNLNATKYFISPNGSDGYSGTSERPWKTLSYASTRVVSGDVIQFVNGIFPYDENVSYIPAGVSIEGYPGKTILIRPRIVFMGIGGDQHISGIIFDGDNIPNHNAILILHRSHIRITNCKFINFKDGNLYYASNEYEYAIEMRWTHDIEIDNNILECGIRSLYDNRNLNIHHNNVGKPSMNVEPEVGIYLCDVDYVRIWNNKFKNLATFIEFSSFGETKLFNIYVFCNLMINSGVSSPDKWGYGCGVDFAGTTKGIVRNINIVNNTIVGEPDDRYTMIGIFLPSVNNAKQITIINNIIFGFQYASIFGAGEGTKIDSIIVESNILYGNAVKDRTYAPNNLPFFPDMRKPTNSIQRENIIEDPEFVGNGDYHLKTSSPGIGIGISVEWIDSYLDGDKYFGLINIGAYNGYPETDPIPNYDPNDALFIYPVPVDDNINVIVTDPDFTPTQLRIYDMNGREILYIRMTSETILNYPVNLLPGIYLVKVTNDNNNILVKKIVTK
jgi:hypothetical protein